MLIHICIIYFRKAYIYIYQKEKPCTGVSSNRLVFKAAIRRDFQQSAFPLDFLLNYGPNVAHAAFGCFV